MFSNSPNSLGFWALVARSWFVGYRLPILQISCVGSRLFWSSQAAASKTKRPSSNPELKDISFALHSKPSVHVTESYEISPEDRLAICIPTNNEYQPTNLSTSMIPVKGT
jgi:hypothetical protein